MMTIRNNITLPTIFAGAGLLLTIVGIWTGLNMTITGVEAKVADQDRRIASIEIDQKAGRADTTQVLQEIAEIKTDLRYLRQAFERDERK